MKDIDAVPSNVQSARQEALLYVSEDNEAVIKMIIKGRSPTMRHVSITHRVALDWLFDRINLQGNLMPKRYLHGPLTWKVMQRNVWKDIANLRIKQLCSCIKSQRHAWMTIILKKKKVDMLENCPQSAQKLF